MIDVAEDLVGRYQLLVEVLRNKVTPRFRRGPRRKCAREVPSRHASGNAGLSVRTYPEPGRAGAHDIWLQPTLHPSYHTT